MSSSSHSTKSIGSELKSLKTLLKEVSQTVQSIAYRQLESETKLNVLTKAKDEKSHILKKLPSHAYISKDHDSFGEGSIRVNDYYQAPPRRHRRDRKEQENPREVRVEQPHFHGKENIEACLDWEMRVEKLFASHKERKERNIQKKRGEVEREAKEKEEKEKHEKTLEEQKAWEKSVPSHKVIQQDQRFKNTFENMCLAEQPQSLTFCKGTLATLSEKEESLKEACIDKNEIDYFSYVLGYHQVNVKFFISIYKNKFLCEVGPKETCHVLLRQPLQSVQILINNGCHNETILTHKRKSLHEGELMGQIRVDKTLELLKGKFLSPMRKEVQRHYLRYNSCFQTTPKAMSHELYTPSPFANDPWEDINFILKLPRTTKGCDSIFMVMDKLFSREVIHLHGLSSSIVLNRVPNFANHDLRISFGKLATKLHTLNSYHPQTHGQNIFENLALSTMPRINKKCTHNSRGGRLTQEDKLWRSKRLLSEIKSEDLRIDLLKEGGDDGHHPATTIP
ncbi:uncharacterized protein [Phaseolus vulgaris]|uniref:uncharacterized protein n=1 Tax=Phaseolus vulgaris TaxID=3885 RepID=UPI0035CB6E63